MQEQIHKIRGSFEHKHDTIANAKARLMLTNVFLHLFTVFQT